MEYQVSSILNDFINMIQMRAEKKGLDFQVNINTEIPDLLYGDEVRIKQVVTNILTNAVKYTQEGSVTLSIDAKKISDEAVELYICVKDTGIGIKADEQEKLFSAFERIDEERNRNIEGTGLGMNITNRLLAMMGTSVLSGLYSA